MMVVAAKVRVFIEAQQALFVGAAGLQGGHTGVGQRPVDPHRCRIVQAQQGLSDHRDHTARGDHYMSFIAPGLLPLTEN